MKHVRVAIHIFMLFGSIKYIEYKAESSLLNRRVESPPSIQYLIDCSDLIDCYEEPYLFSLIPKSKEEYRERVMLFSEDQAMLAEPSGFIVRFTEYDCNETKQRADLDDKGDALLDAYKKLHVVQKLLLAQNIGNVDEKFL